MRCKQMFFALVAMLSCFVSSAFAQNNVAKVGDTEYAKFKDALQACVAGDNTITLLDDCAEVFTFAQTKGVNITVDGDGNTFSGKITLSAGGGNLTFTDAVIAPANSQSIYVNASTAPNLVFDGCKLQGKNSSGTIVYCYSSNTSNSVTVKNCEADNLQYIVSCRQTGAKSVTVENVTATNMIYLVRTLKCPSVTIKNVTCDAVIAVDIKNDNANGKLTLENVNFNVRKYNGVYNPIINGGGAGKSWTVDVKGTCKFTNDGKFCDEWFVGNDGYKLVIDEYAVINHKEPSGKVAYRADVTDKEDREGIAVLLKDVYAQESVVVKVYHDETLMFTCERRDVDDEGKVMFPVDGNTTANIVLWGKVSGSWINNILVEPTVENVPNKIEVYSDDVLVDTYTNDTGTVLGDQLNNYLALDCVKKPVAEIGDKTYMTLSAAVAAAKAGDVITFVADITEDVTVSKNVTIDGADKLYTGTMTANTSVTVQNVNFVNAGFTRVEKTAGTYNIKKCTFDGKGTYPYAFGLSGSGKNNKLNIEDCTVNNYLYSFLYVPKAGTTISVKNVVAEGLPNYAVMFNSGFTASFENFTVKNSPIGIYVNNSTAKRSLTINGCAMENVGTAIQHRDGTNTITVNASGNIDFGTAAISQYVVFPGYEALTGGVLYTDFADALNNVKEDGVVNMLADVTVESSVKIAKAITLNGNGKTLTYTGSGASARAIDVPTTSDVELDVTIKNLTVDCTASYCQRGINYNDNGKLTLDNVTVKGTNVTYALNLPGSSVGANVTINNSNLTANIALNVWGKNAVINATDSHFTSVDKSTVEGYSAIALNNDGTTAAEGAEINIIGGSITAKDENGNLSNAVRNATATGTINVSETTVVTGNYTKPVAIVTYANTDQFYSCATLQAAIDKAIATNGTVKLIADVEGAGAVINGSVAIDFNGKTYTANAGVGSKGTETLGLQILKGDVVLKNGTLTSEGENIKMLINNYTNLIVDNMNLVDATDVIQYVLSNNCGNVAINNSVITSDAVALDACKYANYEAPVVTVADGSTINGNVEVSATLNMNGSLTGKIVINRATGVVYGAEGLNVTTNVEEHKVVYENGVYKVAEKHYVAKVDGVEYETLQDAINAAQDSETVTLLVDVELGLADAVSNKSGQKVLANVDGKNITLNMNGKKISVVHRSTLAAERIFAVICVEDGAGLTVTGEGSINVTTDITDANVMPKVAYMFWKRGTTGYLVIENGNYYMDNSEDSMVYTNGNNIVTVKDGTFILGAKGTRVNGFPWIFNAAGNNEKYITVLGGTYNYDICDQFWKYEVKLGEGCAIKDNGDDIWTVIKVGAYVAESAEGPKVPYTSLAEAVAAAQDGNIVTLAKNLELTEAVVVPADKTLVLDLNGKTVTMNDASGATAVLLKNNGNLTIMDGTEAKAGKLSFKTTTPSAANAYASNTITNYGTLTIESGNVENLSVGGGACYALDNYAGSTATINGGKLTAEKTAVRIFNWTNGEEAKATINMNGGEIYSKNGYGINVNSGNAPFVALNIAGGTITTDYADYKLAVYVVNKGTAENFTANVTGGTFNGIFALNGVTAQTMKQGAVAVSGGTFEGVTCYEDPAYGFVSGGTFKSVVDAKAVATGYATVDNHDGTWTVESLYVDYMVLDTDAYKNFEVQNEKKVAELRLIRDMKYDAASGVSMVDKWTGIYLPFALPVSALGDDYEVAYFNDIHCYDKDEDGKIDDMAVEYVKIKSGTLYPNTPYAIKPKTEDAVTMDIVLGNVTLVPTGENNNVIECSSAFVAFQFGGVYNRMTATELLENVNTTYLSIEKTPIAYLYWNGKLNTDLANPDRMLYYPFQVYMTLCAKDGSPYELDTEKLSTIGSRVVGEENDGVTTIYDVPEEMDVEGLIFDLSGRRVNETEKGIYIKDGKKVLVK